MRYLLDLILFFLFIKLAILYNSEVETANMRKSWENHACVQLYDGNKTNHDRILMRTMRTKNGVNTERIDRIN